MKWLLVLLSVQSLLASPEPKDPQDAVVAKQCLMDKRLYQKTAKFWSQHYASALGSKDSEILLKVSKLQDMGVSRTNIMTDGTNLKASAPTQKEPTKLRPCCLCKETRELRDECIFNNGEEKCGALIEAHKKCLREFGFEV